MPPPDPGLPARALRVVGRFLLRVPWPLALVLIGLWGALIWDLSSHSIPQPEEPPPFWEFVSNLAHAPIFGLLTLWVAALVLRRGPGAWPSRADLRTALAFLAVVGYGVLDEWHQSHVPGRDSSALDVLTDATSAASVLWIVLTLGAPDLTPGRLRARLGLCVLACLLAAGLSTAFP